MVPLRNCHNLVAKTKYSVYSIRGKNPLQNSMTSGFPIASSDEFFMRNFRGTQNARRRLLFPLLRKRNSCVAIISLSDFDSSVTEPVSLNHEEHLSGSSSLSSSSSSVNSSNKSAIQPFLSAVNDVYNFSFVD